MKSDEDLIINFIPPKVTSPWACIHTELFGIGTFACEPLRTASRPFSWNIYSRSSDNLLACGAHLARSICLLWGVKLARTCLLTHGWRQIMYKTKPYWNQCTANCCDVKLIYDYWVIISLVWFSTISLRRNKSGWCFPRVTDEHPVLPLIIRWSMD